MKNIQVSLVEVPRVEDIYIMLNQLRKGFLYKSKNLEITDKLACANCGAIIDIIPDTDIICTRCKYTNKIGRVYVTAIEPNHGDGERSNALTDGNETGRQSEPVFIPETNATGKKGLVRRAKRKSIQPKQRVDEADHQGAGLSLLPGSVMRSPEGTD